MKSFGWSLTLSAILCFSIALFLSGCSSSLSSRLETAQTIAASGRMQGYDIATKSFIIRSYERINAPDQKTVRVYIEGDGLAWLDRATPSLDPTPTDPLALSLAAADPAANVIYLARPCQYLRSENKACQDNYWTSEIFSPVIIETMSEALDDIKARHGSGKIELVGYSGGAAVALLVAAQRNDILNIRTVAGNLDTDEFTKLHHVSALKQSQNPADGTTVLADIPQMHFIGSNDDIVPPSIYQNYVNHITDKHCVHSQVIEEARHEVGWIDSWPMFLKEEPFCTNHNSIF